MSIEVVLFVIVGSISVMAAVMMLLSENAVHSALFLILNFICVAFLYVMLDASFLALVQVAVYAGAIMVLFLFVIMLLGAEKVVHDAKQFKWMPWVALALSVVFLITVGVALISGAIDEQDVAEANPQVRVVHVAPDLGIADVYLGDALFVAGLDFDQRDQAVSDFQPYEPGEYTFSTVTRGAANLSGLGSLTLELGQVYTVVLYGEGDAPSFAVLNEDMETLDKREGRVTVFNAYTAGGAVNLVDSGGDFLFRDEEDAADAEVIAANLDVGMASETVLEAAGEQTWVFVSSDNIDLIVKRLSDFEVERNTNYLVILAGQRNALDGETLDPVVVPVDAPAERQFGGPAAVGASLYVDYVLPFEMVAVLLLAAMVGVIVLTQRGEVEQKPGREARRRVSRPLTSVIAAQIGHSVEEETLDASGDAGTQK
jgi:NADH-quinone oxidoreductase subunit J